MDTQNNLNEPRGLKTYCGSKSLFTGLISVLLIFLLVLTVFTGISALNKAKEGKYIGRANQGDNTVSVSGTGEVYAKPDLGVVTFSVQVEGKTVGVAMADNTNKMNAVISAIKAQGVDDKDLKTTNFSIYPRYEYIKEPTGKVIYPIPDGKRVLAGYDVSQSLEVKIRALDKSGAIIDSATKAGASEVGGLYFTIDNEDTLKAEARKRAIDQAKSKADDIASALGVKLVRIVSFQENGLRPYPVYNLEAAKGAGAPVPGAAPQIQTGENKISIDVTIVYEIN